MENNYIYKYLDFNLDNTFAIKEKKINIQVNNYDRKKKIRCNDSWSWW